MNRITVDTIKLPFAMQVMYEDLESEQEKNQAKFEWLTDILLQNKKDVTIVYEQSYNSTRYSDSQSNSYNGIDGEDYNFIKITIKQAERGMVRIVYSGELLPSRAIHRDDNNSYTIETELSGSTRDNRRQNNVMDFLHSIATSYNQSMAQIDTLQNQHKKLKKELLSWKDTATKLQQSWQNEKDDTLQRYLVLLNRVKSDLRCAKDELKKEKDKQALLERKFSSRSATLTNSQRGPPGREAVVDHDDEHDVEMFDEYEVSQLAQGKRVDANLSKKGILKRETSTTPRAAATAIKIKLPNQESSCSTSSTSAPPLFQSSQYSQNLSQSFYSQSSVRENPHTGSKEYYSVADLFRDDDNNGTNPNTLDHNMSSQLSPCTSPSTSEKTESPSLLPGENDINIKSDSAVRVTGKKRSRVDDSNIKKKPKKKRQSGPVKFSDDFQISEEL